jgi:hypothetical protein
MHACEASARLAIEVDDLDTARIRHQAGKLKGAWRGLVQPQNREWVGVRPRRQSVERARIGQARSPYSISHLECQRSEGSAASRRNMRWLLT